MTLTPGTRIGPYEVGSPIGAGGMGEVYRATDLRLRRTVALKVLPAAVAHDSERLARLTREAQLLAALNHPHIAQIHGLETHGPVTALVMELVAGPTLADRIGGRPMPVNDALAVADQIARALQAAHDQGIVHRDLKPENIRLRSDGAVKVLDFGLAKSLAPVASAPGAPEASLLTASGLTAAGVALGTPAYMSPEQTRGQPVDSRTDIWAFGCVLYEMLTGRRAFAAATLPDTLTAVLERQPDWQALPGAAAPLTGVLQRCLEKDAARRLQDIRDARYWIADAAVRGSVAAEPRRPAATLRSWRAVLALLMGAVAGSVATWALLAHSRPDRSSPDVIRFELVSGPESGFSADAYGRNLAVSPDGRSIVYTSSTGGVQLLVLRQHDRLESTPLAGTERGGQPSFSPDGREIVFSTVTELKRVSVDGGPVQKVCDVIPGFRGAAWAADGTIVFAGPGREGLMRVAATGGRPERLAAPDPARSEESFSEPSFLPDGASLLHTVHLRDGQTRIAVRPSAGGDPVILLEGGFGARYVAPGFLVFGRGDRLMAVRFDPAILRVVGEPVAVEAAAFTKPSDGVANVASANGTLLYVAGQNTTEMRRLVWVDRTGRERTAATERALPGARNPRLSPDGHRVALTVGGASDADIWVYELTGSGRGFPVTFGGHNTFPVWSPDGSRIAFLSWAEQDDAAGIFVTAGDGTAQEPTRLTGESGAGLPLDWSGTAGALLYVRRGSLWVQRQGEAAGRPWVQAPFEHIGGRFSPDGRWVAYTSTQSGREEVWIRAFPGPGAVRSVSAGGGHTPSWSRDGTEVFFVNGAQVMAARVAARGSELVVEPPRLLFSGGFIRDDADTAIRFYDVAPDGRILMVEQPETAKAGSIVVVENWVRELETLLPDR